MKEDSAEYLKLCLTPSYAINSDDVAIIETSQKLTQGCANDIEKAIALFKFVRDSITYGVFMISVFEEDYIASRVLEWKKGFCVQKSVLLAALGRAVKIPTRLGFADIRNNRVPPHILEKVGTNVFLAHCYTQFFLNGKWVSATSNFGADMCKRNGLPVVEFDGINDAMLAEKDLEGRLYIEYLERFGFQENLDFKWLYEKIAPHLPADKRPEFKVDNAVKW